MLIAAGFAHDWPDGRGIFFTSSKDICIWCNELDHVRLHTQQPGADVQDLWSRTAEVLNSLEAACPFAHSVRYGYCTSCPSRLGIAMDVRVQLRIPKLSRMVDIATFAAARSLSARPESVGKTRGTWIISSVQTLGVTEVHVLNQIIAGCAELVRLERHCERDEVQSVFGAMPGLGDHAPPGFPTDECPAELPQLNGRSDILATIFKQAPELYTRLRGSKTLLGTGLALCIKAAMDAAADDTSLGPVAGDEGAYEVFRELFDAAARSTGLSMGHCLGGVAAAPLQLHDLCEQRIDPNGASGRAVRVELRRNFDGLRFAPCCSPEERREVERLVVRALAAPDTGTESARGRYYPLPWSDSYVPIPGGSANKDFEAMRAACLGFAWPLKPVELACGLGRHWPDARGIFAADAGSGGAGGLYVRCNEGDHVVVVSTRDDDDLKAALGRASSCLRIIEASARGQDRKFACSERLGPLTVRPEHVGGLHCVVSLRLPRLGARAELASVCEALTLKATKHDGAWDITVAPQFRAASEAALANSVIEGSRVLVKLEARLVKGDAAVEADLKAAALRERGAHAA
eukprot:NODE_2285_length_2247_cov_10.377358.p1 GENE.NODE_2285_length_2247_cov_10.377358~~NODE_2285_length_2247_cov_10.377358.p1  ORF type:complete len:655 (-),score=179.13 NODE_2285_length_2247_cov_10.377358:281-2008(-)